MLKYGEGAGASACACSSSRSTYSTETMRRGLPSTVTAKSSGPSGARAPLGIDHVHVHRHQVDGRPEHGGSFSCAGPRGPGEPGRPAPSTSRLIAFTGRSTAR